MTFDRYRGALLDADNVHAHSLLMYQVGGLTVRYAPFDYVNPDARLIILGITPGEEQANQAIRTAATALRQGLPDAEAIRVAKAAASFAGPMRSNLIAMLDHIGVNTALGISSTASLWTTDFHMVQFASALRYPVFKNGRNYTGSNPATTSNPFLREQLLAHTGAELASLPNALVVPLGAAVSQACRWLAEQGLVSRKRLIEGLPHPSGANAERIAYFLQRKERSALSRQTDPERIEVNRETAIAAVAAWNQSVCAPARIA